MSKKIYKKEPNLIGAQIIKNTCITNNINFGLKYWSQCNANGRPVEECYNLIPPPNSNEQGKLLCYKVLRRGEGVFLETFYDSIECKKAEWGPYAKEGCRNTN